MARAVVFSDGATKGNPGPGGWGTIVVMPEGQVTELGGADAYTTNNRMELTGAIRGLEHVQQVAGPVAVYTDSTYVIKGIREWIWGWRRRGWKTAEGADVLNRDLWEELAALTSPRVEWHYVRGHIGTPGNERVDAIADAYARQAPLPLYAGPLSGYTIDVLDLPDDTSVPVGSQTSRGEKKEKKVAHSYLSVVNGKAMRHTTWAECEQRVKGQSGAKFKKALDPEDERSILREWNVNPTDLT